MQLHVFDDAKSTGQAAGKLAAEKLRQLLELNQTVRMVVATGASQFDVLNELTAAQDVDWKRVHAFHLDEYVGLPKSHPASFCHYLIDRFVSKVPLASMTFLDGTDDPHAMCTRAGTLLTAAPIDLGLVGIGENGHLAFNDPPADFETKEPYLVVKLDEACRKQQVGEGWFATLNDVPTHAISMSVSQIMQIRTLICTVPDERKAVAVQKTIEGPVSPDVPASILTKHPDVTLFCDRAAISRLKSLRSA